MDIKTVGVACDHAGYPLKICSPVSGGERLSLQGLWYLE